MKNSEVWDQYKAYTKDITEVSRKLGFAGAAICWILKTPQGIFSNSVLWALAFIVAFFISDILQSLSGALLLRYWIRSEEIKIWEANSTLDGEYLKPVWLDYPSFTFFLLKVFSLLVGFIFIAVEIFKR